MEDVQQVYNRAEDTSVLSIKDWVITLIITAIPLVGIVMLFVWAFGSDTNLNKRNWAKAALLIAAIFAVLYFIIFILFMSLFISSGSEITEGLRELENMN
ncbi:MAG: hypothetical protein RIF34_07455 [Candidatus Kapaibacterium sp.]